jgi:hypothetical protein
MSPEPFFLFPVFTYVDPSAPLVTPLIQASPASGVLTESDPSFSDTLVFDFMANMTSPSLLAEYTGTGTFTGHWFTGLSAAHDGTFSRTSVITYTYNYTPVPVPEPGSLVLMSVGIGVLRVRKWALRVRSVRGL